MNSLLILGINDRLEYSYATAYDMDGDKYIIIRHERGAFTEDVFSIVQCHLVDRIHFYEVSGEITAAGEMTGPELWDFLKEISRSMGEFMDPSNRDSVSMVSMDYLKDIIDNGIDYHGILFISDGRTYQFRVVDSRWRRHWKENKDVFQRKKEEAIDYMNQGDVYLVVYKSVQGRRPYIIGIHHHPNNSH